MSFDETREAVRAFIVREFIMGSAEDFSDETSLMDNGIVDSTGALEIVEFLEKAFGVKVEDSDITLENLDSVERICALVGRKLV